MDHSEDFENGKLFPMIVRYSVPAAISLLITAIYNIVDRIFVGNYCGTSALAGLSVCFPLSFLMMAVGLNCSAGGATLFSLFRGRGEKKDMSRSFGNSVCGCAGHGCGRRCAGDGCRSVPFCGVWLGPDLFRKNPCGDRKADFPDQERTCRKNPVLRFCLLYLPDRNGTDQSGIQRAAWKIRRRYGDQCLRGCLQCHDLCHYASQRDQPGNPADSGE